MRPHLATVVDEATAIAVAAGWRVVSRASTGTVYLEHDAPPGPVRQLRIADHYRHCQVKAQRRSQMSINVAHYGWRERLAYALEHGRQPPSAKALGSKESS